MRDALVPLSDRDAEGWLKRAEEAAARADWKLAADTLARVIDQYGDKTVSLDEGQHFYSAAHCALDQIARWPADGLATYRLLYDAEVRQRLDTAVKAHDLDALRLIARKFPFATPGPEAMNLLAAWLLDRRLPGEALDILHRLSTLPESVAGGSARGGNPLPRWQIVSKLCVAYALAGQSSAAAGALSELKALADRGVPGSDGVLPADWPQRVASIEHFLTTRCRDRTSNLPTSIAWSIAGGPAASSGRMPYIEPAVAPDDFWRDRLPGAERINPRRISRLIKATSRPPVWQAVSDGRSLFATCPEGLIARDLATFDFLWRIVPRSRVRDPQIDRFRRQTGMTDVDNRDRLDELSTRTLWHEYRGAVSTAYGVVFVIEQSGTTNELFPSRQGQAAGNESINGGLAAEPNSIRAFEASTGRALWTLGRSGRVEDELRAAHFFAPPVALESQGPDSDLLIAPYLQGDDYYLAVLRPNGSIIKKVLLGAGRSNLFPINAVLQPIVHEGTIYIPTGAGVLVALNADDFSLRWLTRYERATLAAGPAAATRMRAVWTGGVLIASAQPDEWLTSPPLVTAGLVIVAAPDSEYLVAYDRKDGRETWAYPRGRLRYLVGSDGQRVIAAGKHVIAIDLTNGSAAWMFDRQSPSGRPALCGDAVLVPSEDGLIRLNAENGKEIGDPMPSRFPLGNLLSADGSLYSVTATDVTKFPDVDQSRRMAHQALERNPEDVAAMLRLAGLAILEKKWDTAVSFLDRASATADLRSGPASATADLRPATQPSTGGGQATAELLARIARHRVNVLLSVAAEGADSPRRGSTPVDPSHRSLLQKSRRELLEEAVRCAQGPHDAVRAGLALCELAAEERQTVDAFLRVLDLLRRAGDQPVALEPQLSATASVLFRERLCGWWRTLSVPERKKVADKSRQIIEAEWAAGHQAVLVHFADALDLRPSGEDTAPMMAHAAWLDLELGKRALDDGDYETGVFHLERAAERLPKSDTAIEALGRLALAYARPGDGLPSAPREAVRCLSAFESYDRNRPVPAELGRLAGYTKIRTMADFASCISKALPTALLRKNVGLPSVLRNRPRLELVADTFTPAGFPPDVMSFHDPANPIDLFDQTLPIRMARQARGLCYSANVPDRYYWAADIESSSGSFYWASFEQAFELSAQPAAISNRVALLSTGDSICAVGLTSGRLMWPPLIIDLDNDELPHPPILCVGGTLIVAPNASTLIAVAPRQTVGPFWRRRFAGKEIGALASVAGHVVVIDATGEIVTVIDPASGRVQRQFTLASASGSKASDGIRDQGSGIREERPRPTTPDPRPLTPVAGRSVQRRATRSGRGRDETKDNDQIDDAESATSHVAIVGTSVCRALQDHVIAKDISSGRTLWDTPLGGLIRGLLPLNETQLGVCYAGSHLAVVNADSGAILKDFDTKGLVLPPIDATLDLAPSSHDRSSAATYGRLLIYAQTRDDPPRFTLSSYPMDKGEQPWQRDLGRLGTVNRRMLRASPDYLAVVEYTAEQEAPDRFQPIQAIFRGVSNTAHLLVIDKSDGHPLLESAFTFEKERRPNQPGGLGLITDVIILEERIIAVGPDGYYVLSSESREEK